jgi:hypothetical protein
MGTLCAFTIKFPLFPGAFCEREIKPVKVGLAPRTLGACPPVYCDTDLFLIIHTNIKITKNAHM